MQMRTRLGVLAVMATVAGAAPAMAQALPAGVTPAMVEQGKAIFGGKGLCYACHGKAAEGALHPNTKLTEHTWLHSDGSYPAIVAFVTKGVSKDESKSGIMMPAKGGSTISEDEVKAVAAYVYSVSRKK